MHVSTRWVRPATPEVPMRRILLPLPPRPSPRSLPLRRRPRLPRRALCALPLLALTALVAACATVDDTSPCALGVPWCGDPPVTAFDASTPPDAPDDHDSATSQSDVDTGATDAPSADVADASPGAPALALVEVLADPEGADGDGFAEFVELRGAPGEATDGWTLALVDGRTGDTYAVVPLLGAVPDDGLLVVGGTGVPEADAILPTALQQGPDGVVLYDASAHAADAVAWGGPVATVPGPSVERPSEGHSLVRCVDGWRAGAPTPGRDDPSVCDPRPPTPDAGGSVDADDVVDAPVCAPAAASVRIHEVLYDPEGADGDGREFVELVGPPATPLDGVVLVGSGDDGTVWLEQALDGMVIDDDGYALVGGAALARSDAPLASALQNGPDGVALDVCGATTDDARWPAGQPPGRTLARCVANDESPTGWFAADPTPRAVNDGFDEGPCGPQCHPLVDHVRIAEVLFDVPGPDSGHEFVELTAPAGTRLDGLVLVGINGSTGTPWFTSMLSGVVPDTARFVVAGDAVDGRDLALEATLQNGPDSIVLADCDGLVLDAIGWGAFGAFDTFAGEGTPAPSPQAGSSLSRVHGDTNDNAADFEATPPSPGW